MTFPAPEEPDLSTGGEPHTMAVAEESEAAALAPTAPASAALSEKPVLEWTTDDWARWIEQPPPVTGPAPEPDFFLRPRDEPTTDEPHGEAGEAEMADPGGLLGEPTPTPTPTPAPPDEARIEGGPKAALSLALDEPEGEDDDRWWSSVAGLAEPAPPVAPPAGAPPLVEPPPVAPPPPPAPPLARPSAAPPPVAPPPVAPRPPLAPPVAPPLLASPPVAGPRPAGADVFAGWPQSVPGVPEAVPPPRSSPPLRPAVARDADDVAMRVRAGLSLLGVSVLVGAVAAGLITVAIFMAAVVLRRALG
ncbi:MAG: hypothetical protein M3P85_05520 [Actinomycetota bacterium]|nr:hypothetical protein [Actinomycetota bacterium]